jgi:hypothetical protein
VTTPRAVHEPSRSFAVWSKDPGNASVPYEFNLVRRGSWGRLRCWP